MSRKTNQRVPILVGILGCGQLRAQAPPPTILLVDVENTVEYQEDISGIGRLAWHRSIPATFT